jgi:hypothetical protein
MKASLQVKAAGITLFNFSKNIVNQHPFLIFMEKSLTNHFLSKSPLDMGLILKAK